MFKGHNFSAHICLNLLDVMWNFAIWEVNDIQMLRWKCNCYIIVRYRPLLPFPSSLNLLFWAVLIVSQGKPCPPRSQYFEDKVRELSSEHWVMLERAREGRQLAAFKIIRNSNEY